jgi:hypothetical protein
LFWETEAEAEVGREEGDVEGAHDVVGVEVDAVTEIRGSKIREIKPRSLLHVSLRPVLYPLVKAIESRNTV